MKRENIYKDIEGATKKLLEISKELSFNNISDNCSFIISEIKGSFSPVKNYYQIRKVENDKKTPKSLQGIVNDIEKIYDDLYDVNLYIYKAKRDATIVEVQYFLRSSLDIEYQKDNANQETMLHCKVSLPVYVATDRNQKFDINWELGTLDHKWRMFWFKLRNYCSKGRRFINTINSC